jgi:hypothetical protein
MEVSCQLDALTALPSGKAHSGRWTGGLVSPEPVWTERGREQFLALLEIDPRFLSRPTLVSLMSELQLKL